MDKPFIGSVAIEKGPKAFLPEAYVYQKMFQKLGVVVEFVEPRCPTIIDYDAVVLFHGFHPFWRRYPKIVVGEYHSLSVGKYGRIKDILKRLFNVRADYYIFLNELVRKKLWFSKKVVHSLRGMGFNPVINDGPENAKEFDIVYCGSHRDGLQEVIESLSDMDMKIAVVGVSYSFQRSNITEFGKVTPTRAVEIMKKARFGLNFTPNVFPLNVQDSTKVIEYCGLGLGVITNDYFWVRKFEEERCGKFLRLDEIKNKGSVFDFNYVIPNLKGLEWDEISSHLCLELTKYFCFPER